MSVVIVWKNSLRKVVLRGRDGRVHYGFAHQAELKDKIRFTSREGKQSEIRLTDLKAIFFVKDFRGDPEYKIVSFLGKSPVVDTLWVRVRFSDDEVIEGKVRNSHELLTEPGFYLWPSDPDDNNDSVFILKTALKSFAILAVG